MPALGSTPNILAIPNGSGGSTVVNTAAQTKPFTALKGNPTLLGWGVFLLAMYALNETSTGHEFIFYTLVLIVLFLFIGNYNTILPYLINQN